MTINRSLKYYHSLPLPGQPWNPVFKIFYPPGWSYAEATRDLASRFRAWVWVSCNEVEVMP